jgi:hypothetical protein
MSINIKKSIKQYENSNGHKKTVFSVIKDNHGIIHRINGIGNGENFEIKETVARNLTGERRKYAIQQRYFKIKASNLKKLLDSSSKKEHEETKKVVKSDSKKLSSNPKKVVKSDSKKLSSNPKKIVKSDSKKVSSTPKKVVKSDSKKVSSTPKKIVKSDSKKVLVKKSTKKLRSDK